MERLDRRFDVPALDAQCAARRTQPRDRVRFVNAECEREHARRVDKKARAARLDVDRAAMSRIISPCDFDSPNGWMAGLLTDT